MGLREPLLARQRVVALSWRLELGHVLRILFGQRILNFKKKRATGKHRAGPNKNFPKPQDRALFTERQELGDSPPGAPWQRFKKLSRVDCLAGPPSASREASKVFSWPSSTCRGRAGGL